MKVHAFVGGALLGALVVFVILTRYQLVVTSNPLNGYVLRVDRWTGKADYWTADQPVWRPVVD